jgi:transposase
MSSTDAKLKQKILDSIKNDGISVSIASKEYWVSTVSIYSWLRKEVESNGWNSANLWEIRRLKKDKSDLLLIIWELKAELNVSKKKRWK